jgi:hypothetical protein
MISLLVALCFLLHVQAATKLNSINKTSPDAVNIHSIHFNQKKPLKPGDRIVLLLKGENLQALSVAKLAQKNLSVGNAIIEKYSAKKGTQRRVIVTISKKAKPGILNFTLKAGNRLIKLPKKFTLVIPELMPIVQLPKIVRMRAMVATGMGVTKIHIKNTKEILK